MFYGLSYFYINKHKFLKLKSTRQNIGDSLGVQAVKYLPAIQETWV